MYVRSSIFIVGLYLATIIHSLICLPLFLFMSVPARFKLAIRLNYFVVWWFNVACNVELKITGLENLPPQPSVIVSNHQSEWETFFFQTLVSPLATVLKRELLWVPLFGWALAMIGPIAIDRGAKRNAILQILEQGKARLAAGRHVLIFPESTRVRVGEKKKFSRIGAQLASEAQVPLIPVAHDAGRCWPPRGFAKFPGTIHLQIGAPLMPDSQLSVEEMHRTSSEWIIQQRDEFISR